MQTPLEFPDGLKFNSRRFELGHFQHISPGNLGFLQTFNRSRPGWVAEYTTPPLNEERYNQAIAFFDKLEGSMESFLAYDPRRVMPYAYRQYTIFDDPWTQSGQVALRVTGYNYAASTLSLDRVQIGANFTQGDYISFKVGLLWYLFRVVTTNVAVANTLTVEVRPRPQITGTLPVNVRYRRACCQMKMLGGVKEEGSVQTNPSFSFRAVQFLDRSV
jgi:hypothetical protein